MLGILRRRQALYHRCRIPADIARIVGRSHLTRTLKTSHPLAGKLRAAAMAAHVMAACRDIRRMDVRQRLIERFEAMLYEFEVDHMTDISLRLLVNNDAIRGLTRRTVAQRSFTQPTGIVATAHGTRRPCD